MPEKLLPIFSTPRITVGGGELDLSVGSVLGRIGLNLRVRVGGGNVAPPPANDAPVAQDDTIEIRERDVVQVNRANGVIQSEQNPAGRDTDRNGDALAVRSVKNGSGAEAAAGTEIQGTYGTLTLNADGSYAYRPGDAALALAKGDRAVDVFTYTVADDKGATDTATLSIGITGSDGVPSLQVFDYLPNFEPLEASIGERTGILGQFTFSTPDGFAKLIIEGRELSADDLASIKAGARIDVSTDLGVITLFAVQEDFEEIGRTLINYIYVAGVVDHTNNQRPVDSVSMSVVDGAGVSASSSLDIEVGDTAPFSFNAESSISEKDALTSGQLELVEVADKANFVAASLTGRFGVFELNESGAWTYRLDVNRDDVRALNAGDVVFDTFRVMVRDSDGSENTSFVRININGVDGESSGGVSTGQSAPSEAQGGAARPLSMGDVFGSDGDLPGMGGSAGSGGSSSAQVSWHDSGLVLYPNHGAELTRLAEGSAA